jgi:hypothetical protein
MARGYLPSAEVPTTRKMVNKLLRLYDKCGNSELEDGALWYPRAMETATAIAELTSLSVHQVAVIMAIVSPGTGWKLNKLLPVRVIEHIQEHGKYGSMQVPDWFPGYRPAWHRCRRVIFEGDLTITGRKTRPFYLAIMGDESATVIDRHMVRICSGVDGVQTCSDGPFKRMVEAVEIAAEKRGVSPRTMQATVWTAYRRFTVIPRLGRTIESVYDGNPDAGEEIELFETI